MDETKPSGCLLCSSEHDLLDVGNNMMPFASEYRDVVRVMTGIVIHPNDPMVSTVCRACIRRSIDNYDYRRNVRKRSLDIKRKDDERLTNDTVKPQLTTVLAEEDDDVQFVSISVDITGDDNKTELSVDKLVEKYISGNNALNVEENSNTALPKNNCDKEDIRVAPGTSISPLKLDSNKDLLSKRSKIDSSALNISLKEIPRPNEEVQTETPHKRIRRSVQNLFKRYPNIILPEEILTNGLKDLSVKLTHKPIKNHITKLARRARRLRYKRRRLNSYVTDSPKRLDVPETLPATSKELKELIVSSLGLHRIGPPSPVKTPKTSLLKICQTPKKICFQPDMASMSTPYPLGVTPETFYPLKLTLSPPLSHSKLTLSPPLSPSKLTSSPTVSPSKPTVFPSLSPSKLISPNVYPSIIETEIVHPFYALPVDTEYSQAPPIDNDNCEMPTIHEYSLMKIANEEAAFLCSDCNEVFKTVHVLNRHQKIHKRCIFCRKWFNSSAEVRKHVRNNCPKMTKKVSVRVQKMETNHKVRHLLPPEFFQAMQRSSSPQKNETTPAHTNQPLKNHSTSNLCYDFDDTNIPTKLEFECDTDYSIDLNSNSEVATLDLIKPSLVQTSGDLEEQRINEARYLHSLLLNIEQDIDSSLSLKKQEVSHQPHESPDRSVSVTYTDRSVLVKNLVPHLAANKRIPVRLSYQPRKLKVNVASYSPSIEFPTFYDFKHITPISLLSSANPSKCEKRQTLTQTLKNAESIKAEQQIKTNNGSMAVVQSKVESCSLQDNNLPLNLTDVLNNKMEACSSRNAKITNSEFTVKIPTSKEVPNYRNDHQYYKRLPMSLVPMVLRKDEIKPVNSAKLVLTPEQLVETLHNGAAVPSDISLNTINKVADLLKNMSANVVNNLNPVAHQELVEETQVLDSEPMVILDSIGDCSDVQLSDVKLPPLRLCNSLQETVINSPIIHIPTTISNPIASTSSLSTASFLRANPEQTLVPKPDHQRLNLNSPWTSQLNTDISSPDPINENVAFVKIEIKQLPPPPPPLPAPTMIRIGAAIKSKKPPKPPKKTVIRRCFPQTKPKHVKPTNKKAVSQPPLSEVNSNNRKGKEDSSPNNINISFNPITTFEADGRKWLSGPGYFVSYDSSMPVHMLNDISGSKVLPVVQTSPAPQANVQINNVTPVGSPIAFAQSNRTST